MKKEKKNFEHCAPPGVNSFPRVLLILKWSPLYFWERGMNSLSFSCISRLAYSIGGLIKFLGKESCNYVLKGRILALKILKIDIAASNVRTTIWNFIFYHFCQMFFILLCIMFLHVGLLIFYWCLSIQKISNLLKYLMLYFVNYLT